MVHGVLKGLIRHLSGLFVLRRNILHNRAACNSRLQLKNGFLHVFHFVGSVWWVEAGPIHAFVAGRTLTVVPTRLAQLASGLVDIELLSRRRRVCWFLRNRFQAQWAELGVAYFEVGLFHLSRVCLDLLFRGNIYTIVLGREERFVCRYLRFA